MNLKTDKKLWIGIGISLFFLILLFRKIDFGKLLTALRELDYRYLVPAVLFTFISYYFRAVRWRYLLLPLKRTEMGNLFPATIIGYMANNILPARLGEFVRAYVLAVRERLETSATFASLVVDRLCDGFTVLLILVVTLFSLKLPPGKDSIQHDLVYGGCVTMAGFAGLVVFLVILKRATMWTLNLLRRMLRPFPPRVTEKLIPLLGAFIEGLRLSTRPKDLAALAVVSLAIWTTALVPIDLVLRAFGIVLPFTASMFIMICLVIAVMVPASPGFIGTYHAACVIGLSVFNIRDERAMSIALILHGINFFPVIVVGAYYLWRDKVSLAEVREKSSQQEALSEHK